MSGLERPHIIKRVASACSTPQKNYKLAPKQGEVLYIKLIFNYYSQIYQCQKEIKDNHFHFYQQYKYINYYSFQKGRVTTTVSDPSESDYRNSSDPLLKTTNLSELRNKLKTFKHKSSVSSESDQLPQQHDPLLKTTNLSELLKNRTNTSNSSLSDGTTSKSRIPFHTPRIISNKNESISRLTQSESKLPKKMLMNNNVTTTTTTSSSSRTSPTISFKSSPDDNNNNSINKSHTNSMDDMELLNDLIRNDVDFDDLLLSTCDSSSNNNSKCDSPKNMSLSSPLPSQIYKSLLETENDDSNNDINLYIQKNIMLEKQIREKEEKYENILNEFEEYKTKHESSQELINRLEQQITQQNKKILELESTKNENEGLLSYSESRINELQDQLTKSQNKCKSFECEIEKVYKEIDKIQAKYQSSLDDNNVYIYLYIYFLYRKN